MEILELVFEQFGPDDITAILSLSLTNTYLREVGQKRAWKCVTWCSGPWWLQRLICVGDYVDGDDLPANILRGEEEKTLTGNGEDGARIYEAYQWCYFDDKVAWHKQYDALHTGGKMSRKEQRLMRAMVEPDYSWDGRPETEWILCNWTTAEYVRASAVAELTGSPCHGPYTHDRLSLGHVLLSQICWSADPSAAMRYEGPITRGPWAGHYFGITTVDNLSQDINCIDKQPWKDSTEKIVKQVLEICQCDIPGILAEHFRAPDYESDNTCAESDEEGDKEGDDSEKNEESDKGGDEENDEDSDKESDEDSDKESDHENGTESDEENEEISDADDEKS